MVSPPGYFLKLADRRDRCTAPKSQEVFPQRGCNLFLLMYECKFSLSAFLNLVLAVDSPNAGFVMPDEKFHNEISF